MCRSEPRFVTCPECNGAGEWDEGPIRCSGGAVDPEYQQVICPRCEGTGRAEVETYPAARDDDLGAVESLKVSQANSGCCITVCAVIIGTLLLLLSAPEAWASAVSPDETDTLKAIGLIAIMTAIGCAAATWIGLGPWMEKNS